MNSIFKGKKFGIRIIWEFHEYSIKSHVSKINQLYYSFILNLSMKINFSLLIFFYHSKNVILKFLSKHSLFKEFLNRYIIRIESNIKIGNICIFSLNLDMFYPIVTQCHWLNQIQTFATLLILIKAMR